MNMNHAIWTKRRGPEFRGIKEGRCISKFQGYNRNLSKQWTAVPYSTRIQKWKNGEKAGWEGTTQLGLASQKGIKACPVCNGHVRSGDLSMLIYQIAPQIMPFNQKIIRIETLLTRVFLFYCLFVLSDDKIVEENSSLIAFPQFCSFIIRFHKFHPKIYLK